MTVLKTHFAKSVFFICFYIFQGLFNFQVIFIKTKTPVCKYKQVTLNDCHPANHSGLLCRPSAGEAQTCKSSEEGLTHFLFSASSNSRKKKDSGQESLALSTPPVWLPTVTRRDNDSSHLSWSKRQSLKKFSAKLPSTGCYLPHRIDIFFQNR